MSAQQKKLDKKRPRRIASDEAHAWARNLTLGNTYAKMILKDLALYVDAEAFCFVGIPTIAENCELAQETVRKRLAWLEGIGAIARFPQWIDENGQRNGDGRGRRTTDKIRLMVEAGEEAIEAAARGEAIEIADSDTSESDPLPRGGSEHGLENPDPPAGTPATPPLGLQRPSKEVEGLKDSNLNPEPEIELPPLPGPQIIEGEGDEDLNLEGWVEFKGEFEADGDVIVKSSTPMTLFAALNDQQRRLLTKAARGLIYVRKKQKSTRPKPSPTTFIRETDSWENWAGQAPPRECDFHFVGVESREARAYRNLRKSGRAIAPREDSIGRYMLKRPLTMAELAFENMPHGKHWGFVSNEQQIAAWLVFYSNALPGVTRSPMVEAHIVENDAKRGFYAPWPWPPTKDGKTIPWPEPKTNLADSPASAA